MSALDHTASTLHLHHSPCTFLILFLVFCTRFSLDKVLRHLAGSQSSKPRPQGWCQLELEKGPSEGS